MKIKLFIFLITIHAHIFSMNYEKACKILSIACREKNESEEAFRDRCKKSYKKFALQYHPDKTTKEPEEKRNALEEKFKEIGSAYQFLIASQNIFNNNDFASRSNFQERSSDFEFELEELINRFGLQGRVTIVKSSNVKTEPIVQKKSWLDWLYEKIGINSK